MKYISNNIRFPEKLSGFDLSESGFVRPGSIASFSVNSDSGGYIEQLDLNGYPVRLKRNDVLIGVFGIRHSGTNISGEIPKEGTYAKSGDEFNILSSSGIIGHAKRVPEFIGPSAVEVTLEEVLSLGGKTANIIDLTPYEWKDSYNGDTPIILALGSSAECGKTTMTKALIEDLASNHGMRVAASKANGSGNIRDKYSMRDAGAVFCMDYVDMGLCTTYDINEDVYLSCLKGLLAEAENSSPDVIILECGGDVMWGNVPAVIRDKDIKKNVVSATMCSTDYMAAFGAYRFAKEHGLEAPVLFDVPVVKEAHYRKNYFETLVNSKVYDIMNPEERERMTDKIAEAVGGN